jgi:hypothetical protein
MSQQAMFSLGNFSLFKIKPITDEDNLVFINITEESQMTPSPPKATFKDLKNSFKNVTFSFGSDEPAPPCDSGHHTM